MIDRFVDSSNDEVVVLLLKTIAHPEQGGLGYSLTFFNPALDIDGYEVDHGSRKILLDTDGVFSRHSVEEIAASLREALQVEIAETHASLTHRVVVGSGMVVLGVVETAIGLVGIIVPAPGTTIAGIAVVALGASSVVDGFTQLAGANTRAILKGLLKLLAYGARQGW